MRKQKSGCEFARLTDVFSGGSLKGNAEKVGTNVGKKTGCMVRKGIKPFGKAEWQNRYIYIGTSQTDLFLLVALGRFDLSSAFFRFIHAYFHTVLNHCLITEVFALILVCLRFVYFFSFFLFVECFN